MIKRAHFDHSKFVNDLQKQCKEVLGPRDMLCTIKRTTTSKKKFIYIVISKFRFVVSIQSFLINSKNSNIIFI